MIQSYAPRLIGRPGAAIEEHDGKSIQMAQALGADLAHMDATEGRILRRPPVDDPRHSRQRTRPALRQRGTRTREEIGQETLLRNENQAYLIIDEASYEEGCAADSSTPFFRFQPKWVAETVEELESDMGLPEGTLQSTVEGLQPPRRPW